MPSIAAAQHALGLGTRPAQVIAPYRVNPLGAHVDHQGGAVLARTIDQRTTLSFWPQPGTGPEADSIELISSQSHWHPDRIRFQPGDTGHDETWIRYAQAAAAAFQATYPLKRGFRGYVDGDQIGAGLSSSASVVLAYLSALAWSNDIELPAQQLVELCRQVENDYMGLNNGIQDQMSIVFGDAGALTLLDVNTVSARQITDAASVDQIAWVLCYSGFSRQLISSGFNTRVDECRDAARALDPHAAVLGEVRAERRSAANIAELPDSLARRARHFYSEIDRVAAGSEAWQQGQWQRFGQLMDESCHSSITQYESGSQPMVDLHDIATTCEGVYGSRFCGGGYGGCLLMLCASEAASAVCDQILRAYLEKYPEKKSIARIFVTAADSKVRVMA